MKLDVLRVYRGEPGSTIELSDGALACYTLSDQVGRRLILALGDAPRYGPFASAWFETPTGWESFTEEYPSLGALLRAIGTETELPDTAASLDDAATGSAALWDQGAAIGWIGLCVALLFRIRSRREPARSL